LGLLGENSHTEGFGWVGIEKHFSVLQINGRKGGGWYLINTSTLWTKVIIQKYTAL